jgi:hypothetical protein
MQRKGIINGWSERGKNVAHPERWAAWSEDMKTNREFTKAQRRRLRELA